MTALDKPNIFHRIFKDDLTKFYNSYFENLFDIQNRNKNRNIDELIKFLIDISKKYTPTRRDIMYYSSLIEMLYMKDTNRGENFFRGTLLSLISAIGMMVGSPSAFSRIAMRYSRVLLDPLRIAYKETFGSFPKNTLMYQEAIFISEVISVQSEIEITDKMIKAIQYLA